MVTPIAADYPFLDVLFSMLIFVAFVMWIWLAVTCFSDIFRRHDMGGFLKAIWVFVIIITPYLGVLVYLIFNNKGIAERSAKETQQVQAAFDDRVREAAGTSGSADQIEKAHGLLQSGAITQDEFDRLKTTALAG